MRAKSSAKRCGAWKTRTSAHCDWQSPLQEDILTDLTEKQLDGIRRRVRARIEGIEAGKFVEYEGGEGLKKLADRVKARGRKLLAREASGK